MLNTLYTDIYADGADIEEIHTLTKLPWVKGFTTNPSLMRSAQVDDYVAFAESSLKIIGDKPISFEVFADNLEEIKQQALEIASWGSNVFVKIPITTTQGESTAPVLYDLSRSKVKLNVTAIFTIKQVQEVVDHLTDHPAILSIFAGRIADTGVNPKLIIKQALQIAKHQPQLKVLWASCREIYNLVEANEVMCDIITMPNAFIRKLPLLLGKDLSEFSLETVNMLTKDALAAGYEIPIKEVI